MTFRLKRTIFGRFVLQVCETRHYADIQDIGAGYPVDRWRRATLAEATQCLIPLA